MEYKIKVYRCLFFRDTFNIISNDKRDDLNGKILAALDGNAMCFNDTTGRSRIYDRSEISKIIIKEVKNKRKKESRKKPENTKITVL